MNSVIAGAFSGLFMASVFVCVGPILLFYIAKDPSPTLRAVLERVRPIVLMIGIVILAYPLWSILGAVIGMLYSVSSTQAPAAGLGSPNLVFTTAVVIVAVAAAAPLAMLLRRVAVGVAFLTLAFVSVFGWLLPYMAG